MIIWLVLSFSSASWWRSTIQRQLLISAQPLKKLRYTRASYRQPKGNFSLALTHPIRAQPNWKHTVSLGVELSNGRSAFKHPMGAQLRKSRAIIKTSNWCSAIQSKISWMDDWRLTTFKVAQHDPCSAKKKSASYREMILNLETKPMSAQADMYFYSQWLN